MEQKQDSTSTVYIVTEGSYSDYHIVAVFDNYKKAEDFRNVHVRGGQIETFSVNPFERELREGWLVYYVEVERDGSAEVTADESDEYFEDAIARKTLLVYRQNANYQARKVLITICFARDEQHAIKIANERRAQLIASGEWDSHD